MESKIEEILEQLKLTNKLLAFLIASGEETISKKSLLLLDMGFRPKDVAEMLGVPIGTVTKARSRAKGRTDH
jgi:predicted transcriptional regulator